jgi:hypothetical protein
MGAAFPFGREGGRKTRKLCAKTPADNWLFFMAVTRSKIVPYYSILRRTRRKPRRMLLVLRRYKRRRSRSPKKAGFRLHAPTHLRRRSCHQARYHKQSMKRKQREYYHHRCREISHVLWKTLLAYSPMAPSFHKIFSMDLVLWALTVHRVIVIRRHPRRWPWPCLRVRMLQKSRLVYHFRRRIRVYIRISGHRVLRFSVVDGPKIFWAGEGTR